ncbi:MAG: hypothetical protein JXQ83_04270 [Candidatus Glassbacteria bacterium]|nr:hypothetical protein [Candidatus Glassbacteria bacterium]
MKPTRIYGYPPLSVLPLTVLLLALSFNCSSHARSTAVRVSEPAVPAEEYEADEFIGVPIVGDYDDDPDLDFILEVRDGDRTFKVNVHEDVDDSNREVADLIRKRINEMEDTKQLRVIGYYSPEYRGKSKEYGFMDLKCVVFFDNDTGYEDAYFTDSRGSRYYDNGDVTVVYAPGHHYCSVYYPRYVSPWWDTDGDGIPDRYDPWPLSYDVWYDYNLNGIPDWYDPYYINYYPYWSYWNSGFWVSYSWYSPWYFRHGYVTHTYYDDYRTYTRLYDRQYVGPSRKNYHLDPKTDHYLRAGNSQAPRATTARTASGGGGYTSLPADRRRLVAAAEETSLDPKAETLVSQIGNEPRSFSRNRAVTESTSSNSGRARTTRDDGLAGVKSKSSPGNATTSTVRGVDRDRTSTSAGRTVERADRSLDRTRSGGDDRVLSPASRSRSDQGSATVSSGDVDSKTRPTDSGRLTRPNSSRRTRTDSRYRGSSGSSTGSGSYTPAPSRSREVRPSSQSPQPSASPSTPSRSRSQPSPSARSAPSSGRSSPAPAARSSGSSSRSRSSGNTSRSSSSSGGDRRRR